MHPFSLFWWTPAHQALLSYNHTTSEDFLCTPLPPSFAWHGHYKYSVHDKDAVLIFASHPTPNKIYPKTRLLMLTLDLGDNPRSHQWEKGKGRKPKPDKILIRFLPLKCESSLWRPYLRKLFYQWTRKLVSWSTNFDASFLRDCSWNMNSLAFPGSLKI